MILSKYIFELSKATVGMIRKSINYKWAKKWENLVFSELNYIVGYNRLKKPVYIN